MSPQQRLRTMVVAPMGVLFLTLGALVLPTSVATAAPTPPGSQFPFGGQGAETAPNTPDPTEEKAETEAEERVQKAEDLGGGVATAVIDLATGVFKCGLNIATDSVACPLT